MNEISIDEQVNTYLTVRGYPLFPEWFMKQLRMSVPSERLRLLHSRGIHQLPKISVLLVPPPESPPDSLALSGAALFGMEVESVTFLYRGT